MSEARNIKKKLNINNNPNYIPISRGTIKTTPLEKKKESRR